MISKVEPNRVRRTYRGGLRIDSFTGFGPIDDGELRPEDWIASTTQAFNGTREIVGEGLGRLSDGRLVKDAAGTLPILVKLLDADERLVIQAHPTVPCAREKFGSSVGKTECWYFLPGTADDACVYLGFKPGVTRERWRQAFETQTGLLDMLHRVPVKSGDFVFVDGGMPHAIGAGCFMIELQEPSDLMVVAERFTPSGRRIPDGKIFCGLGFEDMLDVYGYGGFSYDELCARYVRRDSSRREGRVDCPCRCICGPELTDKFEMWHLSSAAHLALGGAAAVAVVVGGEGNVNGLAVRAGERLLAAQEDEISLSGPVEVVVCKGGKQ